MADEISYDAWMADIEKFGSEYHGRRVQFSAEMDRALIECRKVGMPWREIEVLARKWGWPAVNPTTLRKRWLELEGGE